MMRLISFILIILVLASCKKNDDNRILGTDPEVANGCDTGFYPNWETSRYVLPYPVGQSYTIGLSHCSGFPHIEGEPDQFAIDFVMNVGTLVVASRKGTIMYVEESANDFEPTDNVVVLRDEDGRFLHYRHLTNNGALVEVGQFVERGDPIGYSGASGNASYPHLHFVATGFDDWPEYTTSYPVTFGNTSSNPKSLIQFETYEALPY
ncbi:MAG: M23 family metallopeptidase [Bacteroidia bacterium]|nr:M23 family metallopeptidase [Bacteroidia bacterium]MBT8268500.1 M23 family metallopeptidase [Bacteroidia bacterium]NNK69744.1 M23 family metallopeptidase [Flavobacteriaceae bacterium]